LYSSYGAAKLATLAAAAKPAKSPIKARFMSSS
jgi:hypothetical protein